MSEHESPISLNPWMRRALEQQGHDPDDLERRWHESRQREHEAAAGRAREDRRIQGE